ncbi:hypothetical protein ACIRS1_06085 [Kitasatospora sp. NPDC101176]|uniref:hypothetical protein n=1 Tax=Kitasatospora sp. NPDC101176 TaxID=3364099 RepID=UPI0037F3B02F
MEGSISWLMRARRNRRDYERTTSHAEAHLTWTSIALMTRRLTRPVPGTWREPRPPPFAPPPFRLRLQPFTIRLAASPRQAVGDR